MNIKHALALIGVLFLCAAPAAGQTLSFTNLPAGTLPLAGNEKTPIIQNNALVLVPAKGVGSVFQGSSAPPSPLLGTSWYNTSSNPNLLNVWDGGQWVGIGSLNTSTHTWAPSGAVPITSTWIPASYFNIYCNGDGATDDLPGFNAARTYAAANGGAAVWIPPGAKCQFSNTFDLNVNNLVFGNNVGGGMHHDVGTANTANWTATLLSSAGNVPIMVIAPTAGGSNQALTGSGVLGAAFIANSQATIGLEVASLRQGKLDNLYCYEATVSCYEFTSVYPLGEANDFSNNVVGTLTGYEVANAAPIVTFDSASGSEITGNVSMDVFQFIGGSYKNAPALDIVNADNTTILKTQFYRVGGGSAYGMDVNSHAGAAGASGRNLYLDGLTLGAGGSVFRGGLLLALTGSATQSDVINLVFTGQFSHTTSYTVGATPTLTTVATGIAAAINADSTLSGNGVTAGSTGATVIIYVGGETGGEETMTYTQGSNTEAIARTPSDGIMSLSPANYNLQLGHDDTNSDPAPVIAPSAHVMWVQPDGNINGSQLIEPIIAANASDATTGAARPLALGKTTGAWFYDSSEYGFWFDDGTGLWRLAQDSSNDFTIYREGGSGLFELSPGLDNSPIGATTPSTGSFTTLSATSIVSGSDSAWFADSSGDLTGCRSTATGTLNACDGSEKGIQIYDGTGRFRFALDSSHNLQIQRLTGSGLIELNGIDNTPIGATTPSTGTFTTMTVTSAAPTVSSGQIGYGGTTAAASNCNTAAPSATACIVVNIAGTTHYIPYQ